MTNNNDYICLVLGETGVGKSSFINGITNKKACTVSDKGKACTTKFKIVKTEHEGCNYHFIDTPGLNDAKGDEKNINEIKTGLSDYPKFRCILILLKFQDIRLTEANIKNLKIFMKCFPSKQFWKHVFIVRTHADTSSKKFKKEKKKIEGKIVESLNEPDFINFKEFMEQKKIELPKKIDEFYVDNDNEDADNYDNNEEEFNKIFEKIKKIPPMFKEITKIDTDKVVEKTGNKFPVKQTMRIIKYIDYDGNSINSSPFLTFESEESPFPILRVRKRKEVIETESDCGDVKIKYGYYETNVYNVDGKEVEGSECYKGSGWE